MRIAIADAWKLQMTDEPTQVADLMWRNAGGAVLLNAGAALDQHAYLQLRLKTGLIHSVQTCEVAEGIVLIVEGFKALRKFNSYADITLALFADLSDEDVELIRQRLPGARLHLITETDLGPVEDVLWADSERQ